MRRGPKQARRLGGGPERSSEWASNALCAEPIGARTSRGAASAGVVAAAVSAGSAVAARANAVVLEPLVSWDWPGMSFRLTKYVTSTVTLSQPRFATTGDSF